MSHHWLLNNSSTVWLLHNTIVLSFLHNRPKASHSQQNMHRLYTSLYGGSVESILLTATISCLTPRVKASSACSRVWPFFEIPASNSPTPAATTSTAQSACQANRQDSTYWHEVENLFDSKNMSPTGLQIYLWPHVTQTFDILAPKVDHFMPLPSVDRFCQLASKIVSIFFKISSLQVW